MISRRIPQEIFKKEPFAGALGNKKANLLDGALKGSCGTTAGQQIAIFPQFLTLNSRIPAEGCSSTISDATAVR